MWEALGDAIESQHGQESRGRAEREAFSHVVRSVLDSAVPYHPRKGNLFLPGGYVSVGGRDAAAGAEEVA